MLSRRWHIFPPKKPVFEGWAACASGEWSSYQFRRDLDAPPSLPPSLVQKSHRRACFGVLPKRVSAGRERSFSRRARAPRVVRRGRHSARADDHDSIGLPILAQSVLPLAGAGRGRPCCPSGPNCHGWTSSAGEATGCPVSRWGCQR